MSIINLNSVDSESGLCHVIKCIRLKYSLSQTSQWLAGSSFGACEEDSVGESNRFDADALHQAT